MEITITGKQVRVTQTLKRYIYERAQKAGKYLAPVTHLVFTLKKEKYRQIAEVHANKNGFVLQAEEETDDLHVSVDRAMTKIERQLSRHKERISEHRARRNDSRRFVPEAQSETTAAVTAPPEQHEIRSKTRAGGKPADRLPRPIERETIHMALLTLDEALFQMASDKKDFFLFRNRSDRQCHLLYKAAGGSPRLVEVIG